MTDQATAGEVSKNWRSFPASMACRS
jgi:hypothetical protein